MLRTSSKPVFKIATLRGSGFVGCIKRYACIFSELIARHEVGSKIEWIKNKIRATSESRLNYGIENTGHVAGTSSSGLSLQEWRLTSPYFQEPNFVGFEDFEALVLRLIDDRQLLHRVVSVIGMGGLGKTTLTKKVYNTDSIKTHFESCAWISISQEYGERDLLQNVLNCHMVLSEEELKKASVIQLKHQISVYVQEKRYLMVLDDIWTNQAWDAVKDAFLDMNNGSRVMLTMRNKDLALHADARSPPHELPFLNNEESWDLFCRKTFSGQDNGCPQNLEHLGTEIVEKCHGLPLAIVVIGGLLSWKEGRKFPEDYKFQTKKLIRIRAAEGLLQQRGELTLEEVGEDYLKELIQRSIVQVAERSSSGGIKSCRIHHLLWDLSLSEAKEVCFLKFTVGLQILLKPELVDLQFTTET
ncbi:putative disease resistance RPP13-like protein 3 [Magnolia sinica]|uniref:putative disease resistance RPP13-like protein 3 n=1 Tax=Magnolia sinica TaxID=86752 RepID=UPI00265A9265|nr:putative disease resistance RPP13-like protein 3 [Magnolia sinica]